MLAQAVSVDSRVRSQADPLQFLVNKATLKRDFPPSASVSPCYSHYFSVP